MLISFSVRKSHVGRILSTALFLLITLLGQAVLGQDRPSPVPLPVPFTPVVDNANVIDAATRQRLESIFRNLKERADIEFAVLTVQTTGDLDIFDFSIAVARNWGIGSKQGDKAAFLLVVAVQDRKYFTQVSRHLEGDLPDSLVGLVQRDRLVPQFRKREYAQGILDCVTAYVATLGAKRGFSIDGIDQSEAYTTQSSEQSERKPSSWTNICCTIGFVLFILILLFVLSRRSGGGGGGCLQSLLLGSLFSNLTSGSSDWGNSSSGWSGGGFGGSGGGGGGFGGGGDFGGGGAGGSW